MGRRSSIDKLPPEVRTAIERMVADDRMTLDEMRGRVAELFGVEYTPARTPLWNFQQKFKVISDRMKESREIARGIVAEIGEKPDGDQGRAMVETLSALTIQLIKNAASREEIDLDEIRHLARIVKQTTEAGSKALQQAKEIEQAAREKLLREQDAKLKAIAKEGGLTAEQVDMFRRQILGVRNDGQSPPPARQ